MTAAETCRANGWEVGDVLRGKLDIKGDDTYQIVAICDDKIGVRWCCHKQWSLTVRHWQPHVLNGLKRIATAPLDSTPPKQEWFKTESEDGDDLL